MKSNTNAKEKAEQDKKDYDLKNICKWGIDKDTKVLKESLRYMQKYTNYFIQDFQTQEKLHKIENKKQKDEEFE